MNLGTLKPLLTALVMPPMSLLLMAFVGLLVLRKHRRTGIALTAVALALLWVLSTQVTAVWLARNLLVQYPPTSAAQLKANGVQAIVVLGGGIYPEAPEYGQAQPAPSTAARLRYGVWLGRQSGLPLAFTSGIGHAARHAQTIPEAEVAARVASQDYGVTLRWLESQSRDTSENARMLAPILQRDGIKHVALVTDAWHMPRTVIAFERVGLTVTPAPTGYVLRQGLIFEWFPSTWGLVSSQQVLREWLGIMAGRFLPV